jgi:hypothetical protein
VDDDDDDEMYDIDDDDNDNDGDKDTDMVPTGVPAGKMLESKAEMEARGMPLYDEWDVQRLQVSIFFLPMGMPPRGHS